MRRIGFPDRAKALSISSPPRPIRDDALIGMAADSSRLFEGEPKQGGPSLATSSDAKRNSC